MAAMTLQQAFERADRHYHAGGLGEAESLYRQILQYHPGHADSISRLALLAHQRGDAAGALQRIQQAIEIEPSEAAHRATLGLILSKTSRPGDALAAYRAAIALRPDFHEAYNNLGNVLRQVGTFDEAIEAYRRSIAIRPDQPQIHFNLGFALLESGRAGEAEQTFDHAADLLLHAREAAHQPLSAEAGSQLSLILLRRGDFERGWREYESRLNIPGFPVRRGFSEPMWDGSSLGGRRILLHAEQGLGDTIQFCRYVPLVQQCGGRVILQAPAPLTRLLEGQFQVEQVLGNEEPAPPFDMHCPLASLPFRLGTRLETIPSAVPYLHARPTLTKLWRARLQEEPGRLKVGLVWSGNPRYPQDRLRSIPPQGLSALQAVPEVRFISLQKKPADPETPWQSPGIELLDWTAELSDFADTAALVDALDLVIAVDTAVAHLAGAMAKPTWLLLAEPAEWRWLMNRNDSPWYPTMRLFRQKRSGKWDDVIQYVCESLHVAAKQADAKPASL